MLVLASNLRFRHFVLALATTMPAFIPAMPRGLFSHLPLLLAPALALPLACAPEANIPEARETRSFGEVPADFSFATTKKAALALSATPALLAGGPGEIEVRRGDGKVVYRGRLSPRGELRLNLPVPVRDEALSVRLAARGGVREAQVPVRGEASPVIFE